MQVTATTEVQVGDVPLVITATGTQAAPDRLAALERRVAALEERIGPA
jgi:hypothetical protein